MTIEFINRKDELKTLEKLKRVNVIFGRRRVGKTRLVKEFIKRKDALYLLAVNKPLNFNLERFSEQMSERFGIPGLRFATFKQMFEFLERQSPSIIAIDEFGYLIENGILPEFQEILDEVLKKKVLLTGSSISVMEGAMLKYKGPIYGRIDTIMHILPLKFRNVMEWLRRSSMADAIKAYACCDGVPRYLEFFSGKNVENEIMDNFFRQGFLFYDGRALLEEELRAPTRYFMVLEAIANGKNSLNEIRNATGIESGQIPFYLEKLRRLKIISSVRPLLGGKKGIYAISDNYFMFWFKFVYKNEDLIDSGMSENAISDFKKGFNTYLGQIFEKVALEFLREQFSFTRIGKQWGRFHGKPGKSQYEIDIVGIDENKNKITFCECKWQDKADAAKLVEELKEKAKYVDWNQGKRKESYVVFAKSFKKKIKAENVHCIGLKDLENTFRKKR
ncbi:MAG: ATP-binding protein [Nanoarchaeota archaeon]|nr:ATP-binding protein [Nanoarchaeota archaeon]